jgi:hypothetical protein
VQFVKKLFLGCSVVLICVAMKAQNTVASSSSAVVPRLVNFSGKATNDQGKTVTGIVGITFSIYSAQQGGAPLWMETQSVTADAKGNYTVQLGATTSEGLPLSLFTSGDARWLGIRVQDGDEQSRVLLLSVPYALKAADSQTLGGLPASAFALAAPSGSSTQAATGSASSPSGSSSANIGGSGTQDYIPLWTDNNGDLGNSILFQSGTGSTAKIGINEKSPLFTLDVNGQELVRGLFEMATTNYASKTKGYNSQPLNFESSAFNSTSGAYTLEHFQWQAEPTGNNTNNPSATLNLLFGEGTNTPAETGLNIAANGQITFAPGQTFPVAGTITGVTAGTDLTGGGTSGVVTLNVDTTQVPQLAANNNFTGNNGFGGGSVFGATNNYPVYAYSFSPGYTAITGDSNVGSGQTSGVEGVTLDPTGYGVFGVNSGTTGGSVGVYGTTTDPTGIGVAGYDALGNGVSGSSSSGNGVVGTSQTGNAMVANGNASQSRTGGGWIKGMVYVNGNAAPYNIVRCYNSSLSGTAATTPPCGFGLKEYVGPGQWIVDFGFQISDRIWSATLGAPPAPTVGQPTIIADNVFPGSALNLTPSQLFVQIYEQCCGGSSDEEFNWNFTLVVY